MSKQAAPSAAHPNVRPRALHQLGVQETLAKKLNFDSVHTF